MSVPALPHDAKSWLVENTVNRILRFLNPGFGASNAGKVLTSNSTGTDLVWQEQNLLQMVAFDTGAVATGTTTIPFDDTIPQSTEGDQYMSLAITPKSATSKLAIDVTFFGATSALTGVIAAALFQDNGADALAVGVAQAGGGFTNQRLNLHFSHTMTSGTTNETTFKVRAGGASGTVTFNGASGNREFGGVMASSIVIREYAS